MRANRIEYLFSVNTHTPPTMAVDSGEEFTVEVRGAFDDVDDIRAVPTPFTPACDGHPLAAPITGPIAVRGAKPGDVVAIDLSTSQRRLILASQPMVRRLSPGGKTDSNLYGAFPVKWSFGLLAVLCSERESRSSSRRLRSGSRSGRKGSRDRNGSIAWRLAA